MTLCIQKRDQQISEELAKKIAEGGVVDNVHMDFDKSGLFV